MKNISRIASDVHFASRTGISTEVFARISEKVYSNKGCRVPSRVSSGVHSRVSKKKLSKEF